MRKPVLLLDMDGPLADFDRHVWEVIVEPNGIEMNISGLDDPNRKRFLTDNCVHQRDAAFMRKAINDDEWWFDSLPVTDGAIDGTRGLYDYFDVWVCTKPLEANDGCRDGKAAWLRQYLPELEAKMIIAPDKSLVHGAILLDDAPKPEWLDRATWNPVVFPSIFNGAGSEWEQLPFWKWGDDIDWLLAEVTA